MRKKYVSIDLDRNFYQGLSMAVNLISDPCKASSRILSCRSPSPSRLMSFQNSAGWPYRTSTCHSSFNSCIKLQVLYYLSGLTCDDQNFITKACGQRKASELGIALVSPDTSPRANVPGENDKMEVGSAAGFYLNATEGKWQKNYQMYDYIVKELPSVLEGLGGLQTNKVGS